MSDMAIGSVSSLAVVCCKGKWYISVRYISSKCQLMRKEKFIMNANFNEIAIVENVE